MAEMKLPSELTRLRNAQNDRKVETKCERSLQFIMALDKETERFVNSAEIEDENDKALTADQLRTLKEVDTFTVNRLRGLQEELECISSYLGLRASGHVYMAAIKMRMFEEDKAGHKESKYMRDLDKRASKKLKADNETNMMQGFTAMSKSMAMPNQGNQDNQRSTYIQPPGAAPVPPGAPRGKGGGKGKGKAGGKGNGEVKHFVLQFIDGAYCILTLRWQESKALPLLHFLVSTHTYWIHLQEP